MRCERSDNMDGERLTEERILIPTPAGRHSGFSPVVRDAEGGRLANARLPASAVRVASWSSAAFLARPARRQG